MKILRAVLIISFSAMLAFGGCSLFQKEEDDNTALLALLALAWLNANQCQNQSGLVICIPAGFRL